MARFIFVFIGFVGLIFLTAFVASRLVRAKTEGMSVRLQVFLALALIVGAFAFGLGVLVLDRIESRATRLAREAASDEASAIAAFIGSQADIDGGSLAQMAKVLHVERDEGRPVHSRFSLYDQKGKVLFSDVQDIRGPGRVSVSAPIRTRVGVIGRVVVVKPTIIMRRLLEDFAPTVLLISAVLGLAAAVAAALIGRAIAGPIEGLTAYAEKVSEGDRTQKPPKPHGLEVKRLTRAIERMRRELDGLPYVETFAADLSHELKNPVAAIRASAEVLDEGAIHEPEQAERFVRRIREATGRIEALLEELLSLARIEARGVEEAGSVDMRGVVRASVRGFREAGVQLDSDDGQANVRVQGDPRWLRRAIDNLVTNAVVHGTGPQAPHVRLTADSTRVMVVVTNAGRIEPHIRKRLFRRFVTSRGGKGGSGLGLAIVRAVAEAHGGTVAVEQLSPDEVRATLSIPKR